MSARDKNPGAGDAGAGQKFSKTSASHNNQPPLAAQPTEAKRRDSVALAVIDLLCEQFPKCFVRFEARRRPLKLGIHLDLAAALDGAVTAAELGRALRIYASNSGYLDACRLGAARIDLDGNECGEVSAEHAQQSAKLWAQQKVRQAARRAQQDEERAAAVRATAAKAEAEVKLRSGLAALRAAGQRREAGGP